MFVGHYSVAFAAKPLQKTVPLWLLFIAVQWMDVCWSVLVMLGVEKVRVVPGFTRGSSLDLYFMPYTHGLPGALLLALSFGLVTAMVFRERKTLTVAVLAGSVFSHWLLDLVVHVPDLPLVGDTMKVGLGLWRYPEISLPLELALLIAGAFIYDRSSPSPVAGRIALWLFVGATVALQVYANFGTPPSSPQAEAQMALLAYGLLAVLAAGVARLRQPARGKSSAISV